MEFKKTIKILIVLGVIVVIGAALLRYPFWQASSKKANVTGQKIDYVAEINKLGLAGRLENLNASACYNKAIESSVVWKDPLTLADVKSWPSDLSIEKQQLLEEWVSSNATALEQVEKGAEKPYYWYKYSGSFMFESSIESPLLAPRKVQSIVGALCSRAKLEVIKADPDKAVSDLLTSYRFGTHMMGPRSICEQLIGIAVREITLNTAFQILDKEKPSADLLKGFQERLSACSSGQSKPIDFTFEKFLIYDTIQKMFDPNNKDKMETLVKELGILNELTQEEKSACERTDPCEMIVCGDKLFQYLDTVDYPTTLWQLHRKNEDLEKAVPNVTMTNPIMSSFAHTLCGVLRRVYYCKMETEALITTIAILRYKSDKGQLPEGLDALLKAGYLESLPTDPFHNGPLVYKHLGDDFTLYSFGPDFVDDGGAIRCNWREKEKGDIVFWPLEQAKE